MIQHLFPIPVYAVKFRDLNEKEDSVFKDIIAKTEDDKKKYLDEQK